MRTLSDQALIDDIVQRTKNIVGVCVECGSYVDYKHDFSVDIDDITNTYFFYECENCDTNGAVKYITLPIANMRVTWEE